jgi:hypothetical protein
MPNDFITAAQAADRLTISTKTLATWRFKGAGPNFHKFAGAVRYSVADIDTFIAQANRAVQS